jgi:hypothetical protein
MSGLDLALAVKAGPPCLYQSHGWALRPSRYLVGS